MKKDRRNLHWARVLELVDEDVPELPVQAGQHRGLHMRHRDKRPRPMEKEANGENERKAERKSQRKEISDI